MGALLALVPFRDWLYAAIIAAVGLFAWHTYSKYEAAVAYAATVKTESAATEAKARAAIQAADDYYATTLKTIQETANANIKVAQDQSTALASRLRQYAAAHCGNTVLGSSASATASGTASTGGVESAIEQLAAAAAHDNAIIEAERAERDSLTGK
jgi:hypothetical protein